MEEREPNYALIREFMDDPALEVNVFVLLNTVCREHPSILPDLAGHIGKMTMFALKAKERQIDNDWHGLDMAINMILWKGKLEDEHYLCLVSPIAKVYCPDGDMSMFSPNGKNFLKKFLHALRENMAFVNGDWAKQHHYHDFYKLFLEKNKDVEA